MQKSSIFIIVLYVIVNARAINAVFWPCETNADCTAANSSCALDIGLCVCNNFNTVFSEDYTKCLTTSLFGDTCQDSVQCNLMPSGAYCKSGVCDCADGHTYVHGRCRPLRVLQDTCETDLDCYFGYERHSVSCQNSVCACANGYYRRYGNICRRKSMEIRDSCVVNEDCQELGENVKCISLKCVDDTAETATTGETAATPTTTTTTGAAIETATTATSSITINATLPTTISAQTEIPTNQEISWEATNLQLSGDTKTDSNQETESNLINDINELNDSDIEGVIIGDRVHKYREIAVQTSFDNNEFRKLRRNVRNVGTITSSTSTNSQQRKANTNRRRSTLHRSEHAEDADDDIKTYSSLSIIENEANDKKYGSSCTDNGKTCPGLPHSICSNKVCMCRQGYYPKNSKCYAELGEIAESADECEYTFNVNSKICNCQKNYFYEHDLRSCRKPIQYHLSCTSNSQCSPFGAAFCHPDIPRRCTCNEYALYDELQQMCLYKSGLGAQCETNEGCPVDHSVCSNHTCVCQDKYLQRGELCVPGIGANCDTENKCAVDNAYCPDNSTNSTKTSDDKTCQCRRGFVHFKDECLKQAEEIEDECIENEQCKPLLAACIEQKCTCTNEQHLKKGRCETKKYLGESCRRATECYVDKDPETVECRNSICQCKFDYKADIENKHCIRIVPNKKNSSGRPSALKIITLILIGSAVLITSAALKQAYY